MRRRLVLLFIKYVMQKVSRALAANMERDRAASCPWLRVEFLGAGVEFKADRVAVPDR